MANNPNRQVARTGLDCKSATSKSEGANPISDLLVAICWSPGLTWIQACKDQVAQPESTKVSATVRAALTIRMKEMELMDSESNGFSSWCSAQLLNLALSPSLQMNLQRLLQHILLVSERALTLLFPMLLVLGAV